VIRRTHKGCLLTGLVTCKIELVVVVVDRETTRQRSGISNDHLSGDYIVFSSFVPCLDTSHLHKGLHIKERRRHSYHSSWRRKCSFVGGIFFPSPFLETLARQNHCAKMGEWVSLPVFPYPVKPFHFPYKDL